MAPIGAAACAAWSADADGAPRLARLAPDRRRPALRRPGLAIRAPIALRALPCGRASQLEPVVLAPAPLPGAGAPAASSARAPVPAAGCFGSAVAAGFVLVVGTFAVLRPADAPAPAPVALADGGAAAAAASTPALASAVVVAEAAPRDAIVADQRHDPRCPARPLPRSRTSSSRARRRSALPSAFLRSATVDSASR